MTGRLQHYVCGRTRHNLGSLFRGAAREIREFPSGVFLYTAPDGTRVLFDTGYATAPWRAGWRGAIYRRLLPPEVSDADDVAAQLRADGVDPASIDYVVLSHLHPDHVGGLHHFSDAVVVITEGMKRSLTTPGIRAGIIPALLPQGFPAATDRVLTASDFQHTEIAGLELQVVDLLGDGSYLLVELPGHADGHIGALVAGKVLLAGDAAWGSDMLDQATALKPLPQMIQHDAADYLRTAQVVRTLAASGIRVVCSHDPLAEKELLR